VKPIISLAIGLAIGALVPIAFWLGGFDFNHRGGDAVLCFAFTVGLTLWGWCAAHAVLFR
jgi:hypothetical protein